MPRPPTQFPQFSSVGRRRASGCPTAGYLPDAQIATTVFLADRLGKPLLVEGPAGTGKTELAKALAAATGAELIRLQCYEGLDEARALYEWNYKKQLLRIQAAQGTDGADWDTVHDDIFGEEFLLSRPLLTAIRRDRADRAAHRRDRQGRRRGGGPAAGGAVGLPGHHPRARHDHRRAPADGGAHLQRHPRAVRGAQAALPVPGAGLPERRAGAGDRAVPGARPRAGAGRAAGAHRPGAAGAGAEEVAVDLRDPRLGADPARARAWTPSTSRRCARRWAWCSSTPATRSGPPPSCG